MTTHPMKPNPRLSQFLSIHRTFDRVDGKPQTTLFVFDGESVKKFREEGFIELMKTFPTRVVRITSVSITDGIVRHLSDLGITVLHAPWHQTGIAKGLMPEEIVTQYHNADASLFREVAFDPSLAELKRVLAIRNALIANYNASMNKLRQSFRDIGVASAEGNAEFEDAVTSLDELDAMFKEAGATGKAVSYETRLTQLARENSLCRLFNRVAGLGDSSWATAAGVVTIAQGISRFPRVSDFLSYFGMGDAKKQKRVKGRPANWSAEGRRVCYNLGVSIMKNRANPWREVYAEAKAEYLAKHDATCDCGHAKGHSDAQARRLMVKVILKRFYLAASGIEHVDGHTSVKPETQAEAAAAGV